MINPVLGKVCWISGGASGIGESLCKNFAKNGAKAIIIIDVNLSEARRVAEEIKTCETLAIKGNCGNEADIRKSLQMAEMTFGPIGVICANAGILSIGGPEVTNEEWNAINNVNVMQSVFLARHAVPSILRQGGGHFVVTASAAGVLSQIGSLPYSVTKAAAVSIAEWLSITYGRRGLNVTCLCPQAVRTGMIAGTDGGVAGLGGILEPDDVAQEVFESMRDGKFLVSPHKDVLTFIKRKGTNYDRWISGMQKLNSQMEEKYSTSKL